MNLNSTKALAKHYIVTVIYSESVGDSDKEKDCDNDGVGDGEGDGGGDCDGDGDRYLITPGLSAKDSGMAG